MLLSVSYSLSYLRLRLLLNLGDRIEHFRLVKVNHFLNGRTDSCLAFLRGNVIQPAYLRELVNVII